jgi:murein endopeptidase
MAILLTLTVKVAEAVWVPSETCTVKLVADAVTVGVPVRVVVEPVIDEKLNQEGSVEPLATDQL